MPYRCVKYAKDYHQALAVCKERLSSLHFFHLSNVSVSVITFSVYTDMLKHTTLWRKKENSHNDLSYVCSVCDPAKKRNGLNADSITHNARSFTFRKIILQVDEHGNSSYTQGF